MRFLVVFCGSWIWLINWKSVLGECECRDGDMKLEDMEGDSVGRVEICYKGIWGTVCDELANDKVAYVVCKSLGKALYDAKVVNQYGGGKSLIHLHSVQCIGNETSLLDCEHEKTEENPHPYCEHLDEIGVSCAPRCNNGDIRLLRDRVQFCVNDVWGYICYDRNWTRKEGSGVCQQLGFSTEDSLVDYDHFYDRSMFAYYKVQRYCLVNDTNETECHWNLVQYLCTSGSTAKVFCSRAEDRCKHTNQFRQRPLPGTSLGETGIGRLEMCYLGYWGSVCRDYADINTAFVACKQLGYSNISKAEITPLGEVNTTLPNVPVVLDNVKCTGSEDSLLKCHRNPFTIHSCVPSEDIILECRERECGKENAVSDSGTICKNGLWMPANSEEGTSKDFTCELLITADQSTTGAKSSTTGSIVGGVLVPATTITLLIIVGIIILLFIKRKRKQKQIDHLQRDIFPGQVTESQPVQTVSSCFGIANDYKKQMSNQGQSLLKVEGRSRLNSHFVRELTHRKFLIHYKELSLLEMIGQGEFGIVYRAKLGPTGTFSRDVAVKTLKGCSNQLEVDKFVEESVKMSRFKHPHVMGLVGICLDAGPAPYIIMPHMANGSLLEYLKKDREKIIILSERADNDEIQCVQKRLMVMCNQIASGMEYLAAEKYVHRDLAARNCMIDSHFVIKISDFGLSEDVFQKNYFREGANGEEAKLPVKWMAPESISDGHFSEKSDVWSYAVTMWEIFSGGKSPYPGTNPGSVLKMLEQGERMAKPYNSACSDEIYVMMLECWEYDQAKRPYFTMLYARTSKLIEGIAGYLEIGFNPFAGDAEKAGIISEPGEMIAHGVTNLTVNVIPPSLPSGDHSFTD